MPVAAIRGVRAPTAVRGLAALLIGPAVAGAVLVGVGAGSGTGTGALGAAAPAAAARGVSAERAGSACRSAVTALLAERSRAVLTRDRSAFLAGIDPSQPDLRARQARVFDALAAVPLASWAYRLGGDAGDGASCPDGGDGSPDGRSAEGPARWSPSVVLAVALDGVDAVPREADQPLGFVRHDGRWYVAEDAGRQLWDTGPVAVVRGRQSLVLGRPGVLPVLRQLAAQTDTAVERVRASWGPDWSQQVVVLVPGDAAGFAALVPQGRPDGLAAVTLPARQHPAEQHPAEQHPAERRSAGRVVLDPAALARLSEVGRQVVLTHEVVHVATADATGPGVPRWLAEGYADAVALRDSGLPVAGAAVELAEDVRAGRLPAGLPGDDRFAAGSPGLGAAYGQAWLAVRMMMTMYGEERVRAVYRDLGGRADPAPGAVERAVGTQLGTSLPELTAAWQAGLRAELA